MRTYKKSLVFLGIGVCLGVTAWFGFLKPAIASQEKPKRPGLSKLPPIKNCLQHVTVVKAELLMWGDSQVASVEVENQAYVGVVSISLEQIVDKHKNSVIETGFTADKPPLIIIPPGERKTITIGNLGANYPIRIGAVTFSDGTEEGCESALKEMRQSKEFHTRKGAKEK